LNLTGSADARYSTALNNEGGVLDRRRAVADDDPSAFEKRRGLYITRLTG
jgi:hypothetical protein